MANKKKHVHKFKRHTYTNGEQVFFCVLDCKFKINTALAVGKNNICNRCGKEFILDENSKRLAKPHCRNCTKGAQQISLNIPIVLQNDNKDITGLRSRLDETLKAIASKGTAIEDVEEVADDLL